KDIVGELLDIVEAELVEDRIEAAGTDLIGGDVGENVAFGLVGRAHVGADQFEQIAIELTAASERQDRQIKAFPADPSPPRTQARPRRCRPGGTYRQRTRSACCRERPARTLSCHADDRTPATGRW